MATRDLTNSLTYTQVKDAVVVTADFNSASVDTKDLGSCLFSVNVGLSGDTLSGSVFIELEVEKSTDDSAWSDCADVDIRTAVTGTNTGTFAVIDAAAEDETLVNVEMSKAVFGTHRFFRVVVNVTGTHTNGTPIGVLAIQGNKGILP